MASFSSAKFGALNLIFCTLVHDLFAPHVAIALPFIAIEIVVAVGAPKMENCNS